MGRRELRESIFQLLFMTEFNDNQEMAEQKQLYLEGIEDIQDKDQSYIQDKFEKIREKLPEIDEALNEASKGWKTSRMGKVELSILRLAVYEMKMDEDVPVGVAINEAVELAKLFGGEDSGSFVNGVLGKIASGKKDSGEEPKHPRRQTHSAKIIIRSSKKDHRKAPEESAE